MEKKERALTMADLPEIVRKIFAASHGQGGPLAVHHVPGRRGLGDTIETLGGAPLCELPGAFCAAVDYLDPTEDAVYVDATDRERSRHQALTSLRRGRDLIGKGDTDRATDAAVEAIAQGLLWLPIASTGRQMSLPESLTKLTDRAPLLGQIAQAHAMGRIRELPDGARRNDALRFLAGQVISECEAARDAASRNVLRKMHAAIALEAALKSKLAAAADVLDAADAKGASKAIRDVAYREWSDLNTRHGDVKESIDAVRVQCIEEAAAALEVRRRSLYGTPESPPREAA